MLPRSSHIMAHQQTNHEGLPTQRRPHAAPATRAVHQDPLHCMRDYGHQRFPDVQQVADETVTFLRSLSQRLRRFQAHTGGFAKATRPQTGTDRGTQDRRPAKIPPVATTKTGRIELTHANNGETLPRRRSTPTTEYRNHVFSSSFFAPSRITSCLSPDLASL